MRNPLAYTPTIEENIERTEALTLDKVRRLYGEQLSAQHGELVAVGDFDPEETVKLVADIVKDWKSATPYERIANPANVGEIDPFVTCRP